MTNTSTAVPIPLLQYQYLYCGTNTSPAVWPISLLQYQYLYCSTNTSPAVWPISLLRYQYLSCSTNTSTAVWPISLLQYQYLYCSVINISTAVPIPLLQCDAIFYFNFISTAVVKTTVLFSDLKDFQDVNKVYAECKRSHHSEYICLWLSIFSMQSSKTTNQQGRHIRQLPCQRYGIGVLMGLSGGFRNLERGVQPPVCKAHLKIFGLPRPLLVIATDW